MNSNSKEEKVIAVIEGLKSMNSSDRLIAITAVGYMAEDARLRELLLSENVLDAILAHTLSDDLLEIVTHGYGVLRNMTLDEGEGVAEYLYKKNVLASIRRIMAKLIEVLKDEKLGPKEYRMLMFLLENVLGFCSALCMADDKAFEEILSLEPMILQLSLKAITCGYQPTAEAAWELVYSVTEDNPELGVKVLEVSRNMTDLSVVSKVYEIGIKLNACSLAQIPMVDILVELSDVIANLDPANLVLPDETDGESADFEQRAQQSTAARSRINAAQIGFELFAVAAEDAPSAINVDAVLTVLEERVIKLCLEAVAHSELSVRAASALNNIAWTFDALDVFWTDSARLVWNRLVPILLGTSDEDIAVAIVGTLSAIAKYLKGDVPLDDVRRLIPHLGSICQSIRKPDTPFEWASLTHKCIQLLVFVGMFPKRLEFTAAAADAIFSLLEAPRDIPPAMLAHVIDMLLDLFGDNQESWEQLHDRFRGHLVEIEPALSRILSGVDKQKQPELHELCENCLKNLDRFILYKPVNGH